MRKERILQQLQSKYPLAQTIELSDESHMHAGRAGQESHFKLLIVDDGFLDVSRVQRQRDVQNLFQEEFNQGLHALTMRLLTAEEAQKAGVFKSPQCRGGEKPQV